MVTDPLSLGVLVIFGSFWLICVAFIIASMVFWIMMLIDAVQRKFSKENDKILWVLVIVLAGIIGALLYYFMVKRKGKQKK